MVAVGRQAQLGLALGILRGEHVAQLDAHVGRPRSVRFIVAVRTIFGSTSLPKNVALFSALTWAADSTVAQAAARLPSTSAGDGTGRRIPRSPAIRN